MRELFLGVFPAQKEFLQLGESNDVFNRGLKMDECEVHAFSLGDFFRAHHDGKASAVHETDGGQVDDELFALR